MDDQMDNFRSVISLKVLGFAPRTIVAGVLILLLVVSVLSNPADLPTATDQALDYHNLSDLAWGVNKVLTLLLLAIFVIIGSTTHISGKLLAYGKYVASLFLAVIIFTLNWLIQLPFERIRTTARNQLEDDPNLPLLQWIFSQFLASLPFIIFSVVAALSVFWLINKSPRKWWLWTAAVFSFLFLFYLVIEPLTIDHQPLGQTPIEVKISELAEKIGVPRDSIVLENCEPFDKCDMAHVSGLGPTRLILLNKGLLENYPETWTIQTFAHESKHYLKDDNLTGWAVLTLIFLALFWFLDRICRVIIARFSTRLGFASMAHAAALPLVILVLHIMYLIALPPINIFRQHVEFEADRFGLELTHENKAFTEMVSSWAAESKLHTANPSLFFMLFRSSHLSDATRISFANEYRSRLKEDPR